MTRSASMLVGLCLLGCADRADLDCPAVGSVLAVGTAPELSAESTLGCRDPSAWFDEAASLDAIWTIDLGSTNPNMVELPRVVAGSDAAFVHVGSRLYHVDATGRQRQIAASVTAIALVDDALVAYDLLTGFLRVYDAEGALIWTKGLDGPTLDAMAASGRGTLVFGTNGGYDGVDVEERTPFGELLASMTLSVEEPSGNEVTIDGQGHVAVLGQLGWGGLDPQGNLRYTVPPIELFEPGAVEPSATLELAGMAVLPLDEGFIVGGVRDYLPFVARIDPQGEILWSTELDAEHSSFLLELSTVWGLALRPDGGVVAVGGENTIEIPESAVVHRSQPFVAVLDAEGAITHGERIAVAGEARSVAVGSRGEIVVAGHAQRGEGAQADSFAWLRRYELEAF